MSNYPPIIALIFWDVWVLVAFACMVPVVVTPTRKLLEWDRRTGYQIYKSWPNRHGNDEHENDENAVKAAGWFYKIYGTLMLIILGAQVVAATGMIWLQLHAR